MIRLDRTGVEPPAEWFEKVAAALPGMFAEEARVFENLPINDAARRSGFGAHSTDALPIVRGKREFPPLWKTQRYVKDQIGAMSHYRCAYCQSTVGASQPGHVDHFRPKSLFPTLAYDWLNYFLGCERCNTIKHDKWPAEGSYVRPDEGDPTTHFVFAEDGFVSAAAGDAEAQRTIEDLGLNREMLRRERQQAIALVLGPARTMFFSGRGRLNKMRVIRELLKPPLSPYSAAINQSLQRLWASVFPADPL